MMLLRYLFDTLRSSQLRSRALELAPLGTVLEPDFRLPRVQLGFPLLPNRNVTITIIPILTESVVTLR